jgi:hypothetical protein
MPSHSTPLKILVAPNAFKESLSAIDAARSIAKGVRRGLPNARITEVPIADGGDGTLEAVISGTGGRILRTKVTGPLGNRITAEYGMRRGKTAVIEMSPSGLALVPPTRESHEHHQLRHWPLIQAARIVRPTHLARHREAPLWMEALGAAGTRYLFRLPRQTGGDGGAALP